MLKKKWFLPVVIIAGVLILLTAAVFALPRVMANMGYSITSGRYLRSDNGDDMLIRDREVIDMSCRDGMFSDYSTGDKILVMLGSVAESYPAQSQAYFSLKLESGDEDDIAESVIESLTELGWINKSEKKDMTATLDESDMPDGAEAVPEETETVSYENGYANMSLEFPEGWEYEIVPYSEDVYSFGISFRPENENEGELILQYYVNGFGVCGTALEVEEVRLGEYNAGIGVYGGAPVWEFVSFYDTPGSYAVMNMGAGSWLEEYYDEVMDILSTAKLGEGAVPESEAVKTAELYADSDFSYDYIMPKFDHASGVWTMEFFGSGEVLRTVYIDSEGNAEQVDIACYSERQE